MQLNIKRLTEGAILPRYSSVGAAGADIFATSIHLLNPGDSELVHTGWAVEIPPGFCIMGLARSGIGTKKRIVITQGSALIDSDYRGELMIPITNDGDEDFMIDFHDRIAQIVVVPVIQAEFAEVTELTASGRGADGFGSTG